MEVTAQDIADKAVIWHRLFDRIQRDPTAVEPEQLSQAFTELEEAITTYEAQGGTQDATP